MVSLVLYLYRTPLGYVVSTAELWVGDAGVMFRILNSVLLVCSFLLIPLTFCPGLSEINVKCTSSKLLLLAD